MEQEQQSLNSGGQEQPADQSGQRPPLNAAPSGDKNIGMAIVAYILFFIPLFTEAKNDQFVRYHVRQGCGLFIVGVAISLILWALPFLWVIGWIFQIALLALFVLGVVNAAQGKKEQLPVIGAWADKLHI